jgi:hypothetical protein
MRRGGSQQAILRRPGVPGRDYPSANHWHYRYHARRAGRPEPLFFDYEVIPNPNGSITAKPGSFRRLTEEELS